MGPVAVPGGEERQHGGPELRGGAEAPRAQALPLQDTEEQFDLIHPRGVFRRVVEHEALAVAGIEGGPALLGPVEVDVEAIRDDMHGAGGVRDRHRLDEAHEIGRRAGVATVADDPAAVHLERTEQRLGPMTRVLELPLPRPPRARGAVREAPLQGLHARLLVDREHHRPRGRMQVQVGDRRHLLPKLGVGTVQPTLTGCGRSSPAARIR